MPSSLKLCFGETPVSWLVESDNGADYDKSGVEADEMTSVEGEVQVHDGIEEAAELMTLTP